MYFTKDVLRETTHILRKKIKNNQLITSCLRSEHFFGNLRKVSVQVDILMFLQNASNVPQSSMKFLQTFNAYLEVSVPDGGV